MREDKSKIVFLDFCDTVVDFQTADAFVNFCKKRTTYRKFPYRFKIFLHKTRLYGLVDSFFKKDQLGKMLDLLCFSGKERELIDKLAKEFYLEMIKPRFIQGVIEPVRKYIRDNYTVVIVSGGYDAYINYFASEFGIKYIVCNQFYYKKDIFKGKIKEHDCMGQEKISRIKLLAEQEGLILDSDNTVCFSDSESDIPLFKLCKKRFCVLSKEKYHNQTPKWVNDISGIVVWH